MDWDEPLTLDTECMLIEFVLSLRMWDHAQPTLSLAAFPHAWKCTPDLCQAAYDVHQCALTQAANLLPGDQ